MHDREFEAADGPTPPLGTSGWDAWAHVSTEVPNAPFAWVGGGLSLLLWACATLLALQSL